MAELPGGGIRRRKGVGLKRSLMLDTVRGAPRVRAWPRARTKQSLTPQTRAQNEWFRQANRLTKYLPADLLFEAEEATKGTPFYPRDILLMIMAGRAYSVQFDDGRKFYPMAAQIDVSQSLDVLGSLEGMMLVRGPTLWETVPVGTQGLVLISQGPNLKPEWQALDPANGGVAFSGFRAIKNTNQSAGGNARIQWQVADFDPLSIMDFTDNIAKIPASLDGLIGTFTSAMSVNLTGVLELIRIRRSTDDGMTWRNWGGNGREFGELHAGVSTGPVLLNEGDWWETQATGPGSYTLLSQESTFMSLTVNGTAP